MDNCTTLDKYPSGRFCRRGRIDEDKVSKNFQNVFVPENEKSQLSWRTKTRRLNIGEFLLRAHCKTTTAKNWNILNNGTYTYTRLSMYKSSQI